MAKIGKNQVQPKPISQPLVEDSPPLEKQISKGVQPKEQKLEPSKPELNEEGKSRRKSEKKYSGLLKQFWVQGKIQQEEPKEQKWVKAKPQKNIQQQTETPKESPKPKEELIQSQEPKQQWVKTKPQKNVQQQTETPKESPKSKEELIQSQEPKQQWVKAMPRKNLKLQKETNNEPPKPKEELIQSQEPKQQWVKAMPRKNLKLKKETPQQLTKAPKESIQDKEPIETPKPRVPRQRAMGHGESTLPEVALDMRNQVEPSSNELRMTSLKESLQGPLPGPTKHLRDSYLSELEKPLTKNSGDRELQFENTLDSLQKLKGEFGGTGKTVEQNRQSVEKEIELLQETMKDKDLMGSPYLVSVNHGMELKRLGMQPTVAGRIGNFRDIHLETKNMKELGKGALSTVYSGTYQLPDGSSYEGVFKPQERVNRSPGGEETGIDTELPRFGYRNVATTRLDQELGFGLVTRTEMAIHKNTLGTVQERAKGMSPHHNQVLAPGSLGPNAFPTAIQDLRNKGKLGPEEKVDDSNWIDVFKNNHETFGKGYRVNEGKVFQLQDGHGRNEMDFSDPNFRKDLIRLQLMDGVAGQIDRHWGNYMVNRDRDGKYLGLKGIDNDLSWGSKLKSLENPQITGYFNPKFLPPVVDQETYDAFMKLSQQTLSNRMGGLLTQDEIDSGGTRLKQVQDHLKGLQEQGRVIDPKDWGSQQVTEWLMEKKEGEYTSIVARDYSMQEQLRLSGNVFPYSFKE